MTHWIELMDNENAFSNALDWLEDELEGKEDPLKLELEGAVHVPLGEHVAPNPALGFLIDAVATSGICGEEVVEAAARELWRAATSMRGIVQIGENGEAVVEPAGSLVVLFPDGTWDTIGGYTPNEAERSLWSKCAALFTTVPTWLIR